MGDFDRIQMDAHVASGRDGIIERQERMVEDYWSIGGIRGNLRGRSECLTVWVEWQSAERPCKFKVGEDPPLSKKLDQVRTALTRS